MFDYDDYPELLTLDEAAEVLGVCRNTMYNLCRTGQVTCKKAGKQWRISKKELFNFAEY